MTAQSQSAPDVAAMVRRLRSLADKSIAGLVRATIHNDLREAAAMIEKLGQWIPDDALSFCEDCGMYVVSKPPPPERP